jgi:hypothetical protein
VPAPAGLVDGDLLVAGLSIDNEGVTPPAASGWAPLEQQIRSYVSEHRRWAIFWKRAAAEPAQWTWTWSGTAATRGVAALVGAFRGVDPVYPIADFQGVAGANISIGAPGHAAMMLSDNWRELGGEMEKLQHLAGYYVAVRGTGRGSVRPGRLDDDTTFVRYDVSEEDVRHLSCGLARLATLLLAAGASAVFPCVSGMPPIRSEIEAVRWLDERLPLSALSLTTVHAFSSCPIGERASLCAADSFGRVGSVENLYVNDASMLPDSPGVNPQGSVMALARRNALRFADRHS